MTDMNPSPDNIIAPCGMNCAICSRYLAYINNLNKSQCTGCRPRNETCDYMFSKCSGINSNLPTGDAPFCFECSQYPCRQINRMDNRYRENYRMSVKENLECIEQTGIESFIEEQTMKYRCAKCGGLISIHNRKCFHCDTVIRLVEKRSQEDLQEKPQEDHDFR